MDGTTWLPHRSTLSPRGLSALSTSAAGLFSGIKKSSDLYLDTLKSSDSYLTKKKFRLVSGTFHKVQTFL